MMTDERFAHLGFFHGSEYYGGEIITHNLEFYLSASEGWRPFSRRWQPKELGEYTVMVRSDVHDRNFCIHHYQWTGKAWIAPAGTPPLLRVTHYKLTEWE